MLGDGHRLFCFRPRRIDHSDEAEQHELVFDAGRQLDLRHAVARGGRGIEAEHFGADGARGDRQRAERLGGERIVPSRQFCAPVVG